MAGLKFENIDRQKKKFKEQERKITPILLLEEEKVRYELAAKRQGWSVSKYLRVSGNMLDLLLSQKLNDYHVAYEQSILMDKDFRSE